MHIHSPNVEIYVHSLVHVHENIHIYIYIYIYVVQPHPTPGAANNYSTCPFVCSPHCVWTLFRHHSCMHETTKLIEISKVASYLEYLHPSVFAKIHTCAYSEVSSLWLCLTYVIVHYLSHKEHSSPRLDSPSRRDCSSDDRFLNAYVKQQMDGARDGYAGWPLHWHLLGLQKKDAPITLRGH